MNDLVERLHLMLHARLTDEDSIIREAAAEIVRLRGEVAEQRRQMDAVWRYVRPNASNDMEWADEVIIAIDQRATAPAEAKGDACNCPGGSKRDPEKHAPNCPVRTLPCRTLVNPFDTPQPAGGEAVERDPYAPTDGEVLADFMRVCRESKPVGQWPGERVCAAIERLLANQKPFRFIAEEDMAPERDHNGRGGDAYRVFSGPRRAAHPSACEPGADRDAMRTAVADYMRSEGCTCCQDVEAHNSHTETLAKLLNVEPYSDGSGYDFTPYRSQP